MNLGRRKKLSPFLENEVECMEIWHDILSKACSSEKRPEEMGIPQYAYL
jgi:hypothetical protein